MRRTITRYPDDLLTHTQQGPAITGALRQFDIDEEIGDLHLMTVHAKRLEAVSFLADA